MHEPASRCLLARLTSRERARWNSGVVRQRLESAQLVQVAWPAGADALSISCGRPGLACTSQRRGVMPLVLLLKRSGNSSRSRQRSSRFISSVCSADTPLTLWLATIARCAMRTPPFAGLVDQRHAPQDGRRRPGCWRAPRQETAVDVEDDLQVARQHAPIMPTGQVSSASGISVWLV